MFLFVAPPQCHFRHCRSTRSEILAAFNIQCEVPASYSSIFRKWKVVLSSQDSIFFGQCYGVLPVSEQSSSRCSNRDLLLPPELSHKPHWVCSEKAD